MNRFLSIVASLLLLAIGPTAVRASGEAPEQSFGTVRQGAPVERTFTLHNGGAEALRISGVQISPPMRLAKTPAVVAPGADAALKVTLDTTVLKGDYEGRLIVALAGESAPREFALRGKVVPAIEALPLPAVFLSTAKGTAKSASVELVSHEDGPIELALPQAQGGNAVYRAELKPVEPGKRFKLTVTVPDSAPAGRISERIELAVKGGSTTKVPLGVNIVVHERVYTFPDAVDFGSLGAAELHGGNPALRTQTLMVYSVGAKNLSVEAKTDVPGLVLKVEPGPDGDRAQITMSLAEDRKDGAFAGKVLIRTNDPQIRELVVPVSGAVAE